MRMRLATALMAMTTASAGCSDATGPRGIDSYVLANIDGHPLPASSVIADTLRIVSDRHIVGRTLVVRLSGGDLYSVQTPTNLRAPSDSLYFDFHCDMPGTACAGISAPVFGYVHADTLEFVANNWNSQRIYVKR